MKEKRWFVYFIHLLCWSLFLLIPFFVTPDLRHFLGSNAIFLTAYVVYSALLIAFFYYHYLWCLPRFYARHQYLWYGVSVLIFVGLVALVLSQLLQQLPPEVYTKAVSRTQLVRGVSIRFLLVGLISFGIRLYQNLRTAEEEKLQAELLFLKAQINPHFLFNTLNGLYAMAIRKQDETADCIARLSAMMRYVITESNKALVSLEDEITYLQNYIALQQIRLTERTKLLVNIEGHFRNKQIEPLLFISIIENAFKYGISTEEDTTIEIKLHVEANDFYLRVFNQKANRFQRPEYSTETGLANARKRLELLYGSSARLEVEDLPDSFIVTLKLRLS